MNLYTATGFALVLLFTFNVSLIRAQTIIAGNCGPNSCRAGDCEQLPNGYVCHCFGNIKGPDCSAPLVIPPDNACASNPCWGGGTCRISSNTWACDCPPGHSGRDCRTIDPTLAAFCSSNPCRNGGVCTLVGTRPSCTCLNGWTGEFCQTAVPTSFCTAAANPCFNGAICNTTTNKCDCKFGYTGTYCETYIQLPTYNTVRIKNLGWYVAGLELYYDDQDSLTGIKEAIVQKASIAALQVHTFRIPTSASYSSRNGVHLVAFAYLGKQILSMQLPFQNELCIDVWGTTLITFWSPMSC